MMSRESESDNKNNIARGRKGKWKRSVVGLPVFITHLVLFNNEFNSEHD